MSSRDLVQKVYWYVFVGVVGGLIWLVLAVASGSLPWAIIGGLGVGGLALAVSRQWTNALAVGTVVAMIIPVFGTVAIFMPGWYKGLL